MKRWDWGKKVQPTLSEDEESTVMITEVQLQ